MTCDLSPIIVEREARKGHSCPPISAPGEHHPEEGKRQGGPPGGGFLGSARRPARGRERAVAGRRQDIRGPVWLCGRPTLPA